MRRLIYAWSRSDIFGGLAPPVLSVRRLLMPTLIGLSLVGDGLGMHIPKGYIYFTMGFSVFVEMINLRIRPPATPVSLHQPYVREPAQQSVPGPAGHQPGRP